MVERRGQWVKVGKGEGHQDASCDCHVCHPSVSSCHPAIFLYPLTCVFFSTQGNRNRTTHATEVNDVSSRSHAICQIVIRHRDAAQRMYGKLSLVDLAGTRYTHRAEAHIHTQSQTYTSMLPPPRL